MTSLGCRDFDLHEFVIVARCYHQVPGVKMSLIVRYRGDHSGSNGAAH